jgi:predicted transcriptional regulator|tara:strand:+ start:1983 stop:2240 length:258 start_codon:yes stop_codon:yes gene_type:complete
MAIKETKVTDEELKELENFQQNINVITYQLGQLALRKLNINEEEEVLETRYKQLLLEEKEIGDKLKEKYGDASIDLKTGAITNSE